MYAVVSCGGKQYRVSPGDILQVEKLDKSPKEKVELDQVLLINQDDDSIQVGNPYIKGAKVICTLLEEKKGKKIIVFKIKRRKGYRRKKGHRQIYNFLKVEDIVSEKAKPKTKVKTEPKPKAKPEAKVKAKAKPKSKAESKTKAKAEAKPKTATKAKAEAKSKTTTKSKAKPKAAPKAKAKAKTETKTKSKAKKKTTAKSSKEKEQVNGS
jgi:large subunit ribosomal protein L21